MATISTRVPRVEGKDFEHAKLGCPTYIGSISATTTAKNNTDTAVPFAIPAGKLLLIQPDTAVGVTIGGNATLLTSLYLAANEKYMVLFKSTDSLLSIIPWTGTSVVKVFVLE